MAVRFCLPSAPLCGVQSGGWTKAQIFGLHMWLVIASTVYVLTVGVAVAMLIFGRFSVGHRLPELYVKFPSAALESAVRAENVPLPA